MRVLNACSNMDVIQSKLHQYLEPDAGQTMI